MDPDPRIDGIAHTPYWYSAGASSGKLTEPDTDVYVYVHHVGDERSREISMDIDHQNYLFCRIPDLSTQLLIHQSTDRSLVEYIDHLRVDSNILPIMEYAPHAALFRPEMEQPRIFYVPPQFRKIVREMLAFIVYLHAKNYSLSVEEGNNLSLQMNFRVAGNVLKFWRVEFRNANDVTKMRDYRLIFYVVGQLFYGRPEPLPPDYRHLCDRIWELSQRLPRMESSILEHLALLSHEERNARVRAYYDVQDMLTGQIYAAYDAAIIAVGDYFWNWRWTWNVIAYQEFKPARICFAHPFRERYPDWRLEDIPFDVITDHYGDDGNDRTARGFLRFGRNMASHLASSFRQIPIQPQLPRRLTAEEKDIDCIIMHCCGDALLLFHQHLTDELIAFIARNVR